MTGMMKGTLVRRMTEEHAGVARVGGARDPGYVDDMIATMLRLQNAKDALEREEEIGKRVIEQVRANIEADLAPRRQEIEDCRRSIEAFIRQNGYPTFKAPGLGTAYIASRRQTRVVDLEAFRVHLRSESPEDLATLYNEPVLNKTRCKKFAENVMKETGELMPGVESEEVETLTVRLSGGTGGSGGDR